MSSIDVRETHTKVGVGVILATIYRWHYLASQNMLQHEHASSVPHRPVECCKAEPFVVASGSATPAVGTTYDSGRSPC